MSGVLAHSPADIIRTLLIDLGEATAPSAGNDWPAHVSREPDTPDNCITVYDTTPVFNGRIQLSGEVVRHHGIQVRVRSTLHEIGFVKVQDIAVALEEQVANVGVSVGDDAGTGDQAYTIYAATCTSGPLVLGKEPTSNRSIFTVNYTVSLRQET